MNLAQVKSCTDFMAWLAVENEQTSSVENLTFCPIRCKPWCILFSSLSKSLSAAVPGQARVTMLSGNIEVMDVFIKG